MNKRIFVFSNYLPYASVFYVLKALKQLGFETLLVGPEPGHENYIYLPPDGDVLDIYKKYETPFLSLFVETGTGTKFFPENIYKIPGRTAFWGIDNHLNFRWHKEYAVLFDYVFFAQPSVIPWAKRFGLRIFPLLNACDPDIHISHNVKKKYDVVFVGKLLRRRREFFQYLQQHCSRIKFGIFENVFLQEMARIYSAGKVGFNLPVRKDINMRTFEIPACGLLLFSPEIKYLNDVIPEDAFVRYRKISEIPQLLSYYLFDNPEELERKRKIGEKYVREHHTYEKRMLELLSVIENYKPSRGMNIEIHLALLFCHRNAFDRRRQRINIKNAFKKFPLYSLLYLLKYMYYYFIEAFLKNLRRWPY